MPPVHAANLVANSGNTAYGVNMIVDTIFCMHYKCDIALRDVALMKQYLSPCLKDETMICIATA